MTAQTRRKNGGNAVVLALFMMLFLVCFAARAEAAIRQVEQLKVTEKGEREISLAWKRVPGATGYLIEVQNTATKSVKTLKLESNTAQNGWINYKITGCAYCTKYRIRVAACKGKNTGEYCKRIAASTKLIVPGKPEVQITSNDVSAVGVYWKPVPNATYYEIYKNYGGGRKWVGKSKKNKVWVKGLKAGVNVKIMVRAVREKSGNKEFGGFGEASVFPMNNNLRRQLASQVDDRDVYSWGSGDPYRVYSKEQAEAYVNFRNNGGPFHSRTNYFVWVNSRTYRAYIFKRGKYEGRTWVLVHTWPVIIGMPWTPSSRGNYTLHRSWSFHYYSVNYARYCTSYAGLNMIHTLLYPQQSDYLPAGYQASQGCIRMCMAGAKFVYENCDGASMIIR